VRIGIQTILWGRRPPDVWVMLKQAKDARYDGVEIAQHPEQFGHARKLRDRLVDYDLGLVGLSGGALEERAAFLKEYVSLLPPAPNRLYPYLYIDGWEEPSYKEVLDDGLVLALHPHMFRRVQTANEAAELLDEYKALWFLPDTGHLTVAGEDVVKVIEQHYPRIGAVHLKDWNAEVGRAYQFYSRGFCELGRGDVPLDKVTDSLKNRKYDGWLIVEQDAADDPNEAAEASRKWLEVRGL